MPASATPKTILEGIVQWSTTRPLWQQDALRRIIRTGSLTDADIDSLTGLVKQAHGATDAGVAAEPLTAVHIPSRPAGSASVLLTSISCVEGVNQLAAEQTLIFETGGLTIVYGPNGSGKSGYSRILKRACRARMPGEILPDVSKPDPVEPRATISFKRANGDEEQIEWADDGAPNSVLSAVTVFDRDSGAVHFQKKNEAWFVPFGLDIPNTLAALCDTVAGRLKTERDEAERVRNTIFDAPSWSAKSVIGEFLNGLTAGSDVAATFDAISFTEDDDARLELLTVDLAPENDPEKSAEAKRRAAEKINRLWTAVERLDALLSDEALTALGQARDKAFTARAAAKAAADMAFGDLTLTGVGDPVWRQLWDAAHRYAGVAGNPPPSFPTKAGSPCLLCHQTVSEKAAARMEGFNAFIKMDTERAAEEAETAREAALRAVKDAPVVTRAFAEALRLLRDHDAALAAGVRRRLASLRLRRGRLLKSATSGDEFDMPELTALNPANITAAATAIRAYAEEVAASADPEVRATLLAERDELDDRKRKDALRGIAESEIARLKRIEMLDAALGDCASRSVTIFANKLADDFITARMRDRFQHEIVALADAQVRVELTRSGGKSGVPQFEVKLFADSKAKAHLVLSEGEQTCVALAAYFTELANAEHQSALVFDDPVTSLDHRWRRKVAERLVREAATRQIVVFTHDLIFVNDLDTLAQEAKIPIGLRHLARAADGVGVVKEGLPWKGAKLRERVDILEKEARAANKLYDAGEQDDYERAAFRIYDELRATWERGLEDIVFAQVVVRHRDYINTKRLKAVSVFTENDADIAHSAYQKCCDYVRSHDPSRGRDATAPPPSDIMADIETLKLWEEDLRGRQKQLSG